MQNGADDPRREERNDFGDAVLRCSERASAERISRQKKWPGYVWQSLRGEQSEEARATLRLLLQRAARSAIQPEGNAII